MARKPKIIGYGICGKNEKRLTQTLDEFQRLCDQTIICCNNTTQEDIETIKGYGFEIIQDPREWGKEQWKIKQEFVTRHVSELKPDLCVTLDMDEVFDKTVTRDSLLALYNTQFPSFYFYVINLWDEGYNPARNFWNIRAWKFKEIKDHGWEKKRVHCGLSPKQAYYYGFYSPHLLIHYGLKDKEDRDRKVKRYEQYDPNSEFITPEYYQSLKSFPQIEPFDESKILKEVVDYVKRYKQTLVMNNEPKEELVLIQTLSGESAVVPKRQQANYEKQGCKILGDYKELEETLDRILETDEPIDDLEFRCTEVNCGKSFDSARALQGHKMGAHKAVYKKTSSWQFGRKK